MAIKFTITGILNIDYKNLSGNSVYLDDKRKLIVVPAFKSNQDFIELYDNEVEYEVKFEELPYNGEGWDT